MRRKKRNPRSQAAKELNAATQQAASTTDVPSGSHKRLGLARVKDLCNIAGEVIGLIEQRTNSEAEARFVANFVKAAVYHWQPESGSEHPARR